MRCVMIALLCLSVMGCGEPEPVASQPTLRDQFIAGEPDDGLIGRGELYDRIEGSFDGSDGPLPQRDRAKLQHALALAEMDALEFETHYDWDGEHRVTAEWEIQPAKRPTEPSVVAITVPKSISENNIPMAAGSAVGADAPLPAFEYAPTLFPDLLGQAMEHGAARSDGFQCWEFDCTAVDTGDHWRFVLEFAPVAEGFARDEMVANVQPVSGASQ